MTFKEMAQDEQIVKDIHEIKNSIMKIDATLRGDPTSDEPGGIVYNVSRNTNFRKNMVKILWVLFASNAGIITYFIAKLFGGN